MNRMLKALRLIMRSVLPGNRNVTKALINRSGLFDAEYYRSEYKDCGTSPIDHYITQGAAEGANPSPYFDGAWYNSRNPDVLAAGINPLVHFLQDGWREGRHPSQQFDLNCYREAHLSGDNSINPLLHYLNEGRHKELQTFPVSDLVSAEILESGTFDAEYYVCRYADVAGSSSNPLQHFLDHGAAEGRWPNEWFNPAYYLANNPDVAGYQSNPLLHFIRSGWKELRNPGPRFDVWWYQTSYMEGVDPTINPLGHFLRVGRHQGLLPRPPVVPQRPGTGAALPKDKPVRRICLFAGYDVDGVIDDYVVDYLKELSRYADVYYLADCEMQAGQLESLADCTKGAWAFRHGDYDMGSYSRLARDLVGWSLIEEYDELLLVNDSCYLLKSLDDVFSEMEARRCDWWGLQATKGIAVTRLKANNQFQQPIPMETVRQMLLPSFEAEYTYDFLVGSYFLVMRRPVIRGRELRRLLDGVVHQSNKRLIILKYEVGLTRTLNAAGYQFETYIDHLYPFHPIFTDWYFRLLDKGFPLLKRYFVSDNHYQVPQLWKWPERVLRKVPGADIVSIQKNLQRVVPEEKRALSLHYGVERSIEDCPPPVQLLDDQDFIHADLSSPKYPDWWGFPVCAFTGVFSGNERAVFEQVRDDQSIRKIIFTRGRDVQIEGSNVAVVELESPMGQYLLMRCGNLFIKHSPSRNLVYPVASHLHNIINLWHGIPYKRIGFASLDMQARSDAIAEEHAKCRAVIASSKIDAMAMASSFYPLSYRDVWITGLPRNDFILRPRDRLPQDLQQQMQALETTLAGRKLLLYMPTFRNGQESGHYQYTEPQLTWLSKWLQRHNVVIGLREHMADTSRAYTHQFAALDPLDLSDQLFPNVEILYRMSCALITDYSSSFIDYMLTGKPAISFAYDLDSYQLLERGAFYDLEKIFPGPICQDFEQLRGALEKLFVSDDAAVVARRWQRDLFFDYVDDGNSARVVARIKEQSDLGRLGRQWKYGVIQ